MFNNVYAFQKTTATCTGLSDCHKLVWTVLKTTFPKSQPYLKLYCTISKTLWKNIMKRSYLENIYLKKRTDQCLKAYKKQKNYCSRLYKKERKNFFSSLNPSAVKDNKLFWKTVKPFFLDKGDLGQA